MWARNDWSNGRSALKPHIGTNICVNKLSNCEPAGFTAYYSSSLFSWWERNFFSTDSQLRDIGSKNLQSVDPKTHRGDKPKLILTPVVENNIFLFFFHMVGKYNPLFVSKTERFSLCSRDHPQKPLVSSGISQNLKFLLVLDSISDFNIYLLYDSPAPKWSWVSSGECSSSRNIVSKLVETSDTSCVPSRDHGETLWQLFMSQRFIHVVVWSCGLFIFFPV